MDSTEREDFCRAVKYCIAHGYATIREPEAEVSYRSKYKRVRPPEEEFVLQKRSVASAKKVMAELKRKKVTGQAVVNAKIRLGMAEKRLAKARRAMGM